MASRKQKMRAFASKMPFPNDDRPLEENTMSQVEDMLRDLVVANRILSNEDVVDAYGHISVRHPDNPKRFFMSRSRAPELVERHDLIEFDQEGEPINDKRRLISSASSMRRSSRRGPTSWRWCTRMPKTRCRSA